MYDPNRGRCCGCLVYSEAHGELARSPVPVFAYFILSITPSVKERQNGRSDKKKEGVFIFTFTVVHIGRPFWFSRPGVQLAGLQSDQLHRSSVGPRFSRPRYTGIHLTGVSVSVGLSWPVD